MRQTICGAALQHAQFISTASDFRIEIADPMSALTMSGEFMGRSHQRRAGSHSHGGYRTLKARWQRLPGEFCQVRLGIEKIEMAGTAIHEAPDHAFGASGKV